MQIYLKSIRRYTGASETACDETYLLVFVVRVGAVSSANTILYGPWDDPSSGRTGMLFYGPGGLPLVPPPNIWCFGDKPEPAPDPDVIIILAALMENEDGEPSALREMLHARMLEELASAPPGLARDDLTQRLLRRMREALRSPVTIGALNSDDLIDIGEISIRQALQSRLPTIVSTLMTGSAGHYDLFFEIAP